MARCGKMLMDVLTRMPGGKSSFPSRHPHSSRNPSASLDRVPASVGRFPAVITPAGALGLDSLPPSLPPSVHPSAPAPAPALPRPGPQAASRRRPGGMDQRENTTTTTTTTNTTTNNNNSNNDNNNIHNHTQHTKYSNHNSNIATIITTTTTTTTNTNTNHTNNDHDNNNSILRHIIACGGLEAHPCLRSALAQSFGSHKFDVRSTIQMHRLMCKTVVTPHGCLRKCMHCMQ